MKPYLLLLFALLLATIPAQAQRQISIGMPVGVSSTEDAAPDVAATNWAPVTIPHTWNADSYRRGAGWYAKTFAAPTSWKGQANFRALRGGFR